MKHIDMKRLSFYAFLCVMLVIFMSSCKGSDGADGVAGAAGAAGTDGAVGVAGAGLSSENCVVCHGAGRDAAPDVVHNIKEYAHPAPDVSYTGTITDATVDANGKLQITFNVKDNHGDYVEVGSFRDDGPLSAYDVRFYGAKLDSTMNWKQVIYERGTDGTFTDNGNGTYTFASDVTMDAGYTNSDYSNRDATYDATATYRAGIAFGGHGGPASSPTLDFVPNGSTVTDTRNIVATATCEKCHGNEFHGHGGDRKSVENCVLCHNPTTNASDLANNLADGETDSTNMSVMIHNIHNGTDDYWVYRSRAGGNWYSWGAVDEPTGPFYTGIVGKERSTHQMTFPDKAYNCVVCHEDSTSDMSDGLYWQTAPSRVGCGDSCHTGVDWVAGGTGTLHSGGAQTDDTGCAGCHPAAGTTKSITVAHSTANTNIIAAADLALDTPEYTIAVSIVDADGTDVGATDIAGTAASVKIVISKDGAVIDHTTVADFNHANLFVYGPRAMAQPVLTTAAAAGGAGYYANNALATDAKATIAAGSIMYQLDTATGLTAGTYAAYVDVAKEKGDATDGYQAPSVAKVNFQVGTTTVEKQTAGSCYDCHGDTIMHGGKTNSHRHDTTFDAEACAACHDYTLGSPASTAYDWLGAKPIRKRVHSVHGAKKLYDGAIADGKTATEADEFVDWVVGHAPAEEGHVWSHISFPSELNDCAGSCHQPADSSDAWKTNPNQLACMGCHATEKASDHMFLMGGVVLPTETE